MTRVVHLTTVHDRSDPRIFRKECRNLARAGYDVNLVVADGKGDEKKDGVQILDAGPRPKSRLLRMTKTTWEVCSLARKTGAQIAHFHDPELILAGWLLRMRGRHVIYDVHEDYATAVLIKSYIPRPVRRTLSWAIRHLEPALCRPFRIIIAEKYYADRFPKGLPVLNYPLLEDLSTDTADTPDLVDAPRLLYTGNITQARGAYNHVNLLKLNPDVHLYMIGRCSPNLAKQLRERAGNDKARLHIVGEGEYVPFDTILGYYTAGGWTAGLALFPPGPHYMRKEPTKLFEYMAFGIPVLASDFPAWRDLVKSSGSGLVAPPANAEALNDAISFLIKNPEEAGQMGEWGKISVQNSYNWERESERICGLYAQLDERT